MTKKTEYSTSVFSSHDMAMIGMESAKTANEQKNRAIELDIPDTDIKDYFAPLKSWEICMIQGQTSNGKTYFLDWWIRKAAKQIKEQKRNEVIIKISLEESIEAMAYDEYSRLLKIRSADIARGTFEDWAKMTWAMTEIDGSPVWRIADSAMRQDGAPELYLTNIYRCIQLLVSGEITGEPVIPALVALDYLQALPIDPEVKGASWEQQRRLQVARDVFRLREMTTRLQCPFIVTVQAKQELSRTTKDMMLPSIYDGMETSGIATRSDRILSIWMPKTTATIGTQIELPTGFHTVAENDVFLKVNKQRGGLPAGAIYPLYVDYDEHEYRGMFKTVAARQADEYAKKMAEY